MVQPSLFASAPISVAEITRYLRQLLESDMLLQDVWVQGEISNLSTPRSGHIYFTLKDNAASLRCVIWKPVAMHLQSFLRDGLSIEAHGSIGVYERGGQYQLYVNAVRAAGEGLLYQEFLRLKALLEAEGLFDEERKRPIPTHPKTIGIVTSATGAALQDMLNTLKQRYPLAEIILAPAAVQGDAAPPEIVTALNNLNNIIQPDVIIVGRGGGSIEDLWAFNDERVVRTIADSPQPVIAGIGHETDFTLSDFAADLRAPTPTGAAVLATPDIKEIQFDLQDITRTFQSSFLYQFNNFQDQLNDLKNDLERLSPLRHIQNDRQRLDELDERVQRAILQTFKLARAHLTGNNNRLAALNPDAVLKRGYSITSLKDGSILQSIKQVSVGDAITVQLSDGYLNTHVDEIKVDKETD